jgi:hypothetical protein
LAGLLAALLAIAGLTELNAGLVALLLALLLFVTPFVISARIFRHEEITIETLAGAVDIYLLVGILFAVIYRFISYLSGQPFFAQGASPPGLAQYLYFSCVTLSTVGYGDLTAVGSLPRSLSVFEAIAGQVYLVTAVARIVSLLSPRRSA